MCECGVDELTDMLRRVAERNRSGRSMCDCGVDELSDMLRRVAVRNICLPGARIMRVSNAF